MSRSQPSDAGGPARTSPDPSLAGVLSLVSRAVEPPRAADPPPTWLKAAQTASFARALEAVRRHGAACIVDPVGSGKTYVGLAVAAAVNGRRPTVCVVPAALTSQWTTVAARLGVAAVVHSHERVSRGKLPGRRPALVLIDESHRFREPATRRYRTLAPWLVGRAVLMLTATPVVNRPADLLHQLRLGVPDDSLAPFGVVSLAALLQSGSGHRALERLVIAGTTMNDAWPRRSGRVVQSPRDPTTEELAAAVDALQLSRAADIAALVRVSLLRALASSPCALRAALRRYGRLLRNAADAGAAGVGITRRQLHAAVGADDAQLVLWALLERNDAAATVELDVQDLPALGRLQERLGSHDGEACASDRKAATVSELLSDGRVSIVFVTHRETVVHLRDALAERGVRSVGWCTGSSAGVGPSRVPRRAVLAALDPAVRDARLPDVRVLIATDVAAEGLNLQRAERIVHYDLPWTPMRLRQREGRALRLGSLHRSVEVVRFRATAAIERRLCMTRALREKSRLIAQLGLDPHDTVRRRATGATAAAGVMAAAATAATAATAAARHASGARRAICDLLRTGVRTADAPARESLPTHALIARAVVPGGVGRLVVVAASEPADPAGHSDLIVFQRPDPPGNTPPARSDADLLDQARRLLGDYTRGVASSGAATPPAPARLIARLAELTAAAARKRDQLQLARIERALRFLQRCHTAGEAMLAAELADVDALAMVRRLEQVPNRAPLALDWRIVAVLEIRATA